VATIQVRKREADGDDFPQMCMCCGADTEDSVSKTFLWNPGWVIVIIFFSPLIWLIVMLVTRKSMRVRVPMCAEHLGHWQKRNLFTWLGLLFIVGMWICVAVVADQLPNGASGILVVAGLLLSLIWLIAAVIMSQNAIRPTKIDNYGIELVKVNKEFKREWEIICDDAEKRRIARKKNRDKDWKDDDEEERE
jgi:hypothetical protein